MKHPRIKAFFAAAKQETVLDLTMYDIIGEDWWSGGGITPQAVTDAIKGAGKLAAINVHLNSPGGSSFDGVTIHNVLRQAGVPINVIVEGLAASAAFTIAMAGDKVSVCDGAMMMLHNAWGYAQGPAADMRKMGDVLDKVSGTMRDVYAKRCGQDAAAVQALMDAETWLTGQEAVDQGFATELLSTTPTPASAKLAASFDMARFCAKPEKCPLKADGLDDGETEACECPCGPCVDGQCESCTHVDCDPEAENCADCGMANGLAKAAATSRRRILEQRALEQAAL